ncbi:MULTISPECIES: MmcQ/YjbR family DNA-binding protein [Myroides]|uniref:MmcQ/YjbR family DNA-binding protein n=1 Tax=Myroides albus TaxID=2562892 RepID=A0A6I3LK57_9FLAO|nr:MULTISPECIES: MmcQ/YjbR family DNA-binding protein [Myroides]MTG98988.1 MmcQ/YjbR family DNA-binding protein [Myroides albus]MVX35778.1 MmcQ/YjbR family DNA-binding protein [Myroides sp. LoEW2-1]UVD78260.1 MmcQ/YjbR family DNA-binding protein [Myroides albus]
MELEELFDYCSSKSYATSGFPFNENLLTFQVGGKIFAMIAVHFWEQGNKNIILKCPPELALALRDEYVDITHGYTMNKKHWNTIYLRGRFTLEQIKEWVDLSYDLVYDSLISKELNKMDKLSL